MVTNKKVSTIKFDNCKFWSKDIATINICICEVEEREKQISNFIIILINA